jgi:phage-related protein
METLIFPNNTNVSVGSGWDKQARVVKADFVISPVSRARDGINNVTTEYTVSVSMLNDAEAAVLDDFFAARGGAESFYWTMPGETTPRRWTCEKWGIRHLETMITSIPDVSYSPPDHFHSMTATFTEVFAP